MVHQHEYLN